MRFDFFNARGCSVITFGRFKSEIKQKKYHRSVLLNTTCIVLKLACRVAGGKMVGARKGCRTINVKERENNTLPRSDNLNHMVISLQSKVNNGDVYHICTRPPMLNEQIWLKTERHASHCIAFPFHPPEPSKCHERLKKVSARLCLSMMIVRMCLSMWIARLQNKRTAVMLAGKWCWWS